MAGDGIPPTLRALVVSEFGGPDALGLTDQPMPRPGTGQVLIAHAAIGVNFVDLNHRAGAPYPMTVPFVPGIEAVGHVVALGADVDADWRGAYVGYAGPMPGAYATHAVIGTDKLLRIDGNISPEHAAAILMQGMTAYYLTHLAADIGPADRVVVHAAATGVGRHIARWAKAKGATVVGLSRRAEGVDAMGHDGVDHPVRLRSPSDLPDRIARRLDAPHAVSVVFDSVGGDYFLPSLRTLQPKGQHVVFGLAAGMMPSLPAAALSGFFDHGLAGSLRVQWASLGDYLNTGALRQRAADSVFAAITDGTLADPAVKLFGLDQAADAHRWMAAGDGKAILIP